MAKHGSATVRETGGWQEVGVEPDLAVPADRALSVAHLEAMKTLANNSTRCCGEQRLRWLASILQLDAFGAKQLPASLLDSYKGKYDNGKIVVTLEQGQLYFLGASGVKRQLHALSDDTFLIEEPPCRVRIKRKRGLLRMQREQ